MPDVLPVPPDAPDADAPAEAWRRWVEGMPPSREWGLECVSAAPGEVVVRFTGGGFPLNPNGSIHGGLVIAIADQVLGLCAATRAPGRLPATATLNTSFLRPAIGALVYTARVIQAGRTLIFLEATATDEQDRICATFTGTWAVGAAVPR
ncbi:MAG: PaaI family thioesterase [Solirubrobacteraceae bacterium]|nr:PaaI family thioesterase [Solirubrobacteraceae bacterium]